MGYIIWGKIHGSDTLIKLHHKERRNKAVSWLMKNKMYYDDMRVYSVNKNRI